MLFYLPNMLMVHFKCFTLCVLRAGNIRSWEWAPSSRLCRLFHGKLAEIVRGKLYPYKGMHVKITWYVVTSLNSSSKFFCQRTFIPWKQTNTLYLYLNWVAVPTRCSNMVRWVTGQNGFRFKHIISKYGSKQARPGWVDL